MLGDRREAYYDALLEEYGPRYENFDALATRTTLDLVFTCDIVEQIVSCELAGHGLSKSTYNILKLLHHGPAEGMQLHDLGELLLVSRANITGLIDHLEQKGLVTRSVDQADRRARYAKITGEGERLVEVVTPQHNSVMRALLEEMSVEEKKSLVKLLRKLRESVASGRDRCHRAARIRANRD